MENDILGVFGGIAELPSSLELVQAIYDVLAKPLEHPLNVDQLIAATKQVISTWTNRRGVAMQLSENELTTLIEDVDYHWSEVERDTFLKRLNQFYEPFRQPVTETKKSKGKSKKTPFETEG